MTALDGNNSNRLTVLYVDDEEINNFIFVNNFTMYNVVTAQSGDQALDILDNNSTIDAVISDMSMPQMNGLEFISFAKQRHPDIPYFILTAYSYNKDIEDALQLKLIKECFPKPLNVDHIRSTVESNMVI